MQMEELQDLAEEMRDGHPQDVQQEEIASATGEEQQEFYRSQREVDAVIGRRIRQERERFERQHADALALYEALGDLGMGEGVAVLSARRFGVTPEDVIRAMEAQPQGDLREAACRCATERKLREKLRDLPGENVEEVLENPVFQALISAGEPVDKALAYLSLEEQIARAREETHRETLRAIAARQNRPAVLHAPGGEPANAQVGHLPDAVVKAIDQRLKRGEHVRI